MEFLQQYSLFALETLTIAMAIILIVFAIVVLVSKDKIKAKGKLKVTHLNKKYEELTDTLNSEILTKKQHKQFLKEQKKHHKDELHHAEEKKRRKIFVVHFKGDIKASALDSFRQEITAILTVATLKDEVIVCLESPGGMVHTYGLAASQLQRIKDKKIPLTICVDKVAASGGYLMACVADQIIAAPFAIIGSIGVIAQLPNFNRLLKKNNIDFEQLTAGEYKRTLTVFGENTDKARKKMQEDIEDIHIHFKSFISENRPQIDISKVSTGEHWLAKRAFELRLVDSLQTSDDYLLQKAGNADLFEVKYKIKQGFMDKISSTATKLLGIFY